MLVVWGHSLMMLEPYVPAVIPTPKHTPTVSAAPRGSSSGPAMGFSQPALGTAKPSICGPNTCGSEERHQLSLPHGGTNLRSVPHAQEAPTLASPKAGQQTFPIKRWKVNIVGAVGHTVSVTAS
jgi:hypothetical protein